MNEDSPAVTEDWCRKMGFVRSFSRRGTDAREWLLEKGRRCSIGIEFNSEGSLLFVGHKMDTATVILVRNPRQCHVETLDDLVRSK